MQRGLPVPDKYKAERPGSNADLNAYDAIYYGGNANVGAKTIAINLPNDEEVQLAKGTRRLQLENVMQAKFDNILLPIAKHADRRGPAASTSPSRRSSKAPCSTKWRTASASRTRSTARARSPQALKEYASSFEEGKADVLGLYLITALSEKGELDKAKLMDGYVTFLAGILRSVRFGAADSHGKANMVRFHFFEQQRRLQPRSRHRSLPGGVRQDAGGDERAVANAC